MVRSILSRCRPLFVQRGLRSLILLNVLLGLAYSFVGPFMSLFGMGTEVGMSGMRFGVFMTVNALGGVLLGTWLAHYSDTHLSRRRVLLLGSWAGMLGYAGFAFARDYWVLLFIGTCVLGISSVTFSQVFAHAREALKRGGVEEAEMPFYMNAFRMFFALSWTVGPGIASWVMVATGFRGLFLCAAGCFALFLVAVLRTVPEAPPPCARTRAESVFAVLGRGDVLAHFSAFVLVFASGTIGMMNLPLMMIQTLQGTERDVGIAYSLAPLFELPFMLWFGLLATRRSQAGLIRAGFIIVLVYYALLVVVTAPWQVFPLQILSAAATAVTAGVAISWFQNYLPDHPGSATNLYSNAMRIGGTVGYLLFGVLADTCGYRVVFAVCAAFTALALLLFLVKPRTTHAS